MVLGIITTVLVTFFISLHLSIAHGGAKIEFKHLQQSEMTPEDVQIICTPGELEKKAEQILMMQLFREGDSPIVEMSSNSILYTKEEKLAGVEYRAKGKIDKQINKSSLMLTLFKPDESWSGGYSCKIYYVDSSGLFGHDIVKGNLTVRKTESAIMETFLAPIMKKLSAYEDKTKSLETKVVFLEKKTTSLQEESKFLKKKAASLEKERNSLDTETISLKRKISHLEKKTKDLEKETSSIKDFDFSINETVTELRYQNDNQLQEIRLLARNDTMVDNKLGETYTELKKQMDGLADKASVSSIKNRVTTLEKSNMQVKSDQDSDQASMTFLTNRVEVLEQHQSGHSSQLKSLVNKQSAIETNLEQTNQKLSQEVANRFDDKSTLLSTLKNISTLEQKHEDNAKEIQALKSKDSEMEGSIRDMGKQHSQEVTNRLSDKATVTTYRKKVDDLEEKKGEQAKQIESLEDNYSSVDLKLSSIENTNKQQAKAIKTMQNSFKYSVTPSLTKLTNQGLSIQKLWKQIHYLAYKNEALKEKVSKLQNPPSNPKPCKKMWNGVCVDHSG